MRVGRVIKEHGPTVTAVAPVGGIVGGLMMVVGAIVGLAEVTTAEGQPVELNVQDEIAYPKASAEVIAFGDKLYLKANGLEVTKTAAVGLKYVGTCTKAAGNGVTEVRFKQVFGIAEYSVPTA